MRALTVLFVLALSPTALTQQPEANPPDKPAGTPGDLEDIQRHAKAFFASLLLADARSLVEQSTFPFTLEERRFGTSEELLQEWLRQLRPRRVDLLTLYGIEILTPADMEKKYGRPPPRLAAFPFRGHQTYVAVANLSGHAAVAVLRVTAQGPKVIAYHD